MVSINRSIDLIIYIISHFSFIMISFNSEIISVSITINKKLLFLLNFMGIPSNITSFQPWNTIQLSPIEAYSRGGGLLKRFVLYMGAYSKRRVFCMLRLFQGRQYTLITINDVYQQINRLNYLHHLSLLFVMNVFNSEKISVSITLNKKTAVFVFIFVRLYSNIVWFQPLDRIRLIGEGFILLTRGYRFMGCVCLPPFDTLKMCTSSYEMKLKLYRQ